MDGFGPPPIPKDDVEHDGNEVQAFLCLVPDVRKVPDQGTPNSLVCHPLVINQTEGT